MSTTLDPATVLEEAADLLLIAGRCQTIGENDRGQYCALGAIAKVQGIEDVELAAAWSLASETPAALALVPAASARLTDHRARYAGTPNAVWAWNDSTDDDFEVIDTMRHVAKDLRNAGVPA